MFLQLHNKAAEGYSQGKTYWAWPKKYHIEIEEGEQSHEGFRVLRITGSTSNYRGWTEISKEFMIEFTPKDLRRICAAALASNLISMTPNAQKRAKRK